MTPRERYKLLIRALWRRGKNTTAIAEALRLTEQEVCDLMQSDEDGPPKMGDGKV